MPSDKPNILLMISDQQRIDALGYRNLTPCRTPNIDRLANEGISFDRAICTSPLCMPSRASLFTGKYPHQINMLSNNGTLEEPPVLTDFLRDQGYYTAYAGKWHLEPHRQPKAFVGKEKELGLDEVHGGVVAPVGKRVIDRWFDRAEGQDNYEYSVWCEENNLPDGWPVSDPEVRTHRKPSMSIPRPKLQHLDPQHTYDAWVTDIALRFLDERPKDQPFFLVTSWFGPHPPFLIPEPYFNMYDPQDAHQPPNFGPQPGKPRALDTSYYRQLFKDHGETWDAWQKSMAVYWGYCTLVDSHVGRMVSYLEREGILDDTLVIYISDHGEQMGSQGLWQKMVAYEESLRVPMIMRLPERISAGIRSQANSSLIDITPTLLSMLGEPLPSDMSGRDLSPAFNGSAEFQGHAYLYSEHKPLGDWHQAVEWRLVTDNRYKYVWNENDMDELYDLQEDPYELVNLVDKRDKDSLLRQLRAQLLCWMKDTEDPLTDAFIAKTE
jgi:arylsulfatase A-like enzyme